MVNTIKNSMRLAKIFAFAVSVVIFFFPSVAMADSFSYDEITKKFCVDVYNGRFSLDKSNIPVYGEDVVAALITKGQGILDDLEIDDSSGNKELACKNFSVKPGVDVLKDCGTSDVRLNYGQYTYKATGHDFADGKDAFCIDLIVIPD